MPLLFIYVFCILMLLPITDLRLELEIEKNEGLRVFEMTKQS